MTEEADEHRPLGKGRIAHSAYLLDLWLKEHVGRPYTIILGIGLGLGLAQTIRSVVAAAESHQNPVWLIATVVFESALLINQLAQLHEYRQDRRKRKQARREARQSRA